MCTGRVDPAFIFRAFANGQDGVFIGGCLLGECHYITEGNYDALNMVHLCKGLMEHIGLDPRRLRIAWISAAEGIKFADIMNDFSRTVKELGPLGEAEGLTEEALKSGIDEVTELIPYVKVRMREKLERRFANESDYEGLYARDEIEGLFTETASYYIDPERCQACMICGKRCPVGAISGARNVIHVIDQEKCIKCGKCYESCPPRFGAIDKLCGLPVPPPIPEEERTKKPSAPSRRKEEVKYG
jgi:coenzyme F420-reducing hydrogenase delta subunit/ferredoxin